MLLSTLFSLRSALLKHFSFERKTRDVHDTIMTNLVSLYPNLLSLLAQRIKRIRLSLSQSLTMIYRHLCVSAVMVTTVVSMLRVES